jgi:beta-fructofuranosidase
MSTLLHHLDRLVADHAGPDGLAQLQRFAASREALAADPYRPRYHFSPPERVLNDPNGLCRWNGLYHLFYQFPTGDPSRTHWAHAVSEDLVRWKDLPLALYPTTEEKCFSGQTLVERDRVIAIYHGTKSGNAVATAGDPLLLDWEKHPDNPVIPIVEVDPAGNPYRVFDPCIWKEPDGYYALSGTYREGERFVDSRSVDYVFRSTDLAHWEHLGPLVPNEFWTEAGEDGAVPNFLPIGNGKHMLLFFSHKRAAQYFIGTYDRETHTLLPEQHGRMNYGPVTRGSLHAPSATIDDDGRFLAIFNVKSLRGPVVGETMMTLPRHLSLTDDDTLRIEPVTEIESLRGDHASLGPVRIEADTELMLPGINGTTLELYAVLEPGDAREVGVNVLRSPRGEEQTTITLYMHAGRDPRERELAIDVSRGSLSHEIQARSPEIGPLRLADGEPLELRVFIDRSIVEVFANTRQCLTLRTYPTRDDSDGVSVFARGGSSLLRALDAWQMEGI